MNLEPKKSSPFEQENTSSKHPLLLGFHVNFKMFCVQRFVALCGLLVFLISIVVSSQPSCFAASGLYLKGCGWNWSDPEVLLRGLATLQPFLYQLGEIIITDFSWSPLLPLFDCYGVWKSSHQPWNDGVFQHWPCHPVFTRREECEDRPAAFACATWCSWVRSDVRWEINPKDVLMIYAN